MRILLVEFLVGFILGVLFWELFGQRLLAMKYGSLGSTVTCAPDVAQALAEFDSGLRQSAIIGAMGCVVLMFSYRIWRWHRRKKAIAQVANSTGGTPLNP
jgi:hypothetical protein